MLIFNNILASDIWSLLVGLSLISSTAGLYVVNGSNCTAQCRGSPSGLSTDSSDISCYDRDYNTTKIGTSFKRCVSCELESEAFNSRTGQTDLGWALFNLRYTLDQCVFGYPNATILAQASQCEASCEPVAPAIRMNILSPNTTTTYDYCADPSFVQNAQTCAACFKVIPDQLFLANFLRVLASACHMGGGTPTYPFPISSNDIFTWNPPENYSSTSTDTSTHQGLSHASKVAIAISVPVGVFLLFSFALVFIYIRRDLRKLEDQTSVRNPTIIPAKRQSQSRSTTAHSSQPDSHRTKISTDYDVKLRSGQLPLPPSSEMMAMTMPMPSPLHHINSSAPYLGNMNEHPLMHPLAYPARDRNSPIPFFEKRVEIPVPHSTPIRTTPVMTPHAASTPTKERYADIPALPASRYEPPPRYAPLSSRLEQHPYPPTPQPSQSISTKAPSDGDGLSPITNDEPLRVAPSLQFWAKAQEKREAERRKIADSAAAAANMTAYASSPLPPLPVSSNTHSQQQQPQAPLPIPKSARLLSGSPFDSTSPSPPLERRNNERLNWDRIALDNARIRATQAQSPSPVSPMTLPGVFQGARSRPVSAIADIGSSITGRSGSGSGIAGGGSGPGGTERIVEEEDGFDAAYDADVDIDVDGDRHVAASETTATGLGVQVVDLGLEIDGVETMDRERLREQDGNLDSGEHDVDAEGGRTGRLSRRF